MAIDTGRILRLFSDTFGAGAEGVFFAPGRTELGGNHTDHQRGRVAAGAVSLGMLAAARRRGDGKVRVMSEGMGTFEVDISNLSPLPGERGTSAAFVRGLLCGLAESGAALSGADIAVTSGVPVGSGLSSSACFEVLCGLTLAALAGYETDAVELARLAQRAENEFFGKPCGLMDQLACSLGGVAAVDFLPDEPEVRRLTLDPAAHGFALCLVYCGAGHEELTDEYAAIEREMRAVAAEFGQRYLRAVDEGEFFSRIPELRKKLGDRAVLRAMHFFSEDTRAALMADAVEADDFDGFLQLVRESGRSSAMYLQNLAVPGSRGQPLTVAQALCEHALAGRGAVRVHGGGFGGAVQAYVPLDMLGSFRRAVAPLRCVELELSPLGAVRLK